MGARWECPNGKHPAVLAPTKPRRDDVRRFCLPCSEVKGRLVPRVAPRLEAARSEAAEGRKRQAQAARQKVKVETAAYFMVGGVNMHDELRVIWRLPVVQEWLGRKGLIGANKLFGNFRAAPPTLRIRRQKIVRSCLGWANYHAHKIRLIVADGADPDRVISTLLHEVVHIALGKIKNAPHGATFKATLRTLTEEYDALGRRPKMPPDETEDGGTGENHDS